MYLARFLIIIVICTIVRIIVYIVYMILDLYVEYRSAHNDFL